MSLPEPRPAPLSSAPTASGHPWLVADIGGTNARFGLVHEPGAPVTDVRSVKGRDHASPQDAARAYLDDVLGAGGRAGRAALAIAAPVNAESIKLTNSHWVVSRADIARALQTEAVRLLNDFEALALALPVLSAPEGLRPFGSGAAVPGCPKAVVGPGTGLGVAGCVPHGDRWVALAAEGGHVTVSPADAFEDALLRALRPEHPHLSAERLLSGSGLPTLHRGVCLVEGLAHEPLAPEEITRRGLEDGGGDRAARLTLDTFCAMLGTFAGNVALTLGACGGVYVAGGISGILADTLVASRFRERFEAKGRFRAYLAEIPTFLVTAPHAALDGAAAALAQEAG
jgi:glucokinase